MKATGIIRRVDDLGRVVIPKEIRRTLRIKEGDPMELYVDEEGIVLHRYRPFIRVKGALVDTRILVEEHSQDMDPAVAAEVIEYLDKAEKLLCQDGKV